MVPWTSGTLLKAFFDPAKPLPVADQAIKMLSAVCSSADRPSTDSVRRLASPDLPSEGCSACEFYRVEYGFLVQGSLRGVLPPNTLTGCSPAPECQPGPRVMIRGDVGWAGGSAGPDFFIYLGK
eukprot:5232447-Prymnesium_polylepis.1